MVNMIILRFHRLNYPYIWRICLYRNILIFLYKYFIDLYCGGVRLFIVIRLLCLLPEIPRFTVRLEGHGTVYKKRGEIANIMSH